MTRGKYFGTGARRESYSRLPLAMRRHALAAAARGETEELLRRRLCVGRTRRASGIGSACVRQSAWINKAQANVKHYARKYAALAPVVRQGGVYLGVCTGRGLSTARGTAEAEAPEMPVYLGTR